MPPLGKNDWVSCPPGVSDAIFLCERSLWLGGEQGRERLERIELPMRLRVEFLIRVADAHRDDAPEKIEVLMAVGIPHVLILGAGP